MLRCSSRNVLTIAVALEAVARGQQAVGSPQDRLASYLKILAAHPTSREANLGAGEMLDLLGSGSNARTYIQKAIEAASEPGQKALMQHDMALSFAFDGDCAGAATYEQAVFDYWAANGNYVQQGETANEAGRICIDAGDFDTAQKFYQLGHDTGLKDSNMPPGRKELWEFRLESALARIAVRKSQLPEAQKHQAAANVQYTQMALKNEDLKYQQLPFVSRLTGYIAYYTQNYDKALADLLQAGNQDPFVQCFLGMTHEARGNKDLALAVYRQAAMAIDHSPSTAFARPFALKRIAILGQ